MTGRGARRIQPGITITPTATKAIATAIAASRGSRDMIPAPAGRAGSKAVAPSLIALLHPERVVPSPLNRPLQGDLQGGRRLAQAIITRLISQLELDHGRARIGVLRDPEPSQEHDVFLIECNFFRSKRSQYLRLALRIRDLEQAR